MNETNDRIRVGVAACVVGQEVRFNGGHKLSHFVRDTLAHYVDFVPVCPEVELGLGVPRETLRLVDTPDPAAPPRLIAPKSGRDHTRAMLDYAHAKCDALMAEGLGGYILQKGSPSCGMERVKVYPASSGGPRRNGRGLFARVLMERFPYLPVEEDGRLNDAHLRESFIERLFAYQRIDGLFGARWRIGDLVAFHSREKLLLLAHHRPAYQALGRLVAGAKAIPRAELADRYRRGFLDAFTRRATTRKHTDVLSHIAGYFKKLLDPADRAELRELIDAYHRELVPLVVPITLLRHHIRRHDVAYLAAQSYLDPHPRELMLRNHV